MKMKIKSDINGISPVLLSCEDENIDTLTLNVLFQLEEKEKEKIIEKYRKDDSLLKILIEQNQLALQKEQFSNVKGSFGRSILHYVVDNSNLNLTSFLISNGLIYYFLFFILLFYYFIILLFIYFFLGAHVNSKDKFKQIPLHFAAQNDNLELIKLLIQNGKKKEKKKKK